MAHFKRKKPRTRTSSKRYDKWKARRLEKEGKYYWWMGSWPAWWDIIFHRRPHRRRTREVLNAVSRGYIDADAAAYPVDKKPHSYFW